MSVEGRPGVASYGVADEPGHLDFWGAGFFQSPSWKAPWRESWYSIRAT